MFLLLLITFAWPGLQHSRNLGTTFQPSPVISADCMLSTSVNQISGKKELRNSNYGGLCLQFSMQQETINFDGSSWQLRNTKIQNCANSAQIRLVMPSRRRSTLFISCLTSRGKSRDGDEHAYGTKFGNGMRALRAPYQGRSRLQKRY